MPDTPVISKVKLNSVEYDIKDANARSRLDTAESKLSGIAEGATVDDHKWNNVSLTKSAGTTSNNIYMPYMTSTSGTSASLATASTTPTAHYIAKYDASSYLNSTTPTSGDNSTKVATTAFVSSAISALGTVFNYKGTKATTSALPTGSSNHTGDVWIVEADNSEYVWTGTDWEPLGVTVDLSGYALSSAIPTATSDLTNDSGFITANDIPADTKVTQSSSTSSSALPILIRNNTTSTSSTTEAVRFATAVTIQPSTGNLSATKFNNYTLAAACAKAVDTSISAASSSANLPTSAAVASFVENKGYLTLATLPLYDGAVVQGGS